MTPMQRGCSSTYPVDNLNTDTALPEQQTASPHLPEILSRLGGRFAADIADIVQQVEDRPTDIAPQKAKVAIEDEATKEHQAFALAGLRARNIEGTIRYIEQHAPHLQGWLDKQIKRLRLSSKEVSQKSNESISGIVGELNERITISPDTVLIDAEAGRIARVLGQFNLFRAWAYANAGDDGDGRLARSEIENTWLSTGIAKGKRQGRRLLKSGVTYGYWTYDKSTKQLYLTGQIKLAQQLVSACLNAPDYCHLVETNKPGKRRVRVDLSGTLQEASAKLYAAWFVAKDTKHTGTTISREMLCDLWQVSVPTLLTWESLVGVQKQANYAQSNDTTLKNVPAHAYLTLNRDGTTASAWRLPNTYTVTHKNIQQHAHIGKAKRIKQAVRREIALAEQRGSIGDAALPRSGKLYFTEDRASDTDAFKACGDYLRRRSRKGEDIFQRRYFYVGYRYGVRVYEPYNIQTDVAETHIHQRLIWQESSPAFISASNYFSRNLADYHAYLEVFA